MEPAAPNLDQQESQPEHASELPLPIFILAPLRNDARFTAEFLASAGLRSITCEDAESVCSSGVTRCGALLIAEEALNRESVPMLSAFLSDQPRWSDLPVIIITSDGEDTLDRRRRLGSFGTNVNVTLVERPFRPATLVSTIEGALRSRRRQFQVRDLLRQSRQDAEQLRESHERYRALAERAARQSRIYEATIESTVDLLYVFDLEARFILTNEPLRRVLGKRAEEIVGKTFHELPYTPDVAEKLRQQVQEVIATRRPVRDDTYYTGTNGLRIYEYIFAPVFAADGTVEAVAGVTRDVTASRNEERQMRASRDQFQQIADSAPAMLWITEPDGNCTFLSQSWYDYTGQTQAEGHGMGWTNAIHPDERAAAGESFVEASENREYYSRDFRLRRADGEYRWVVDEGRPRFGEGGEFLGYIGSVTDIHERKVAEAVLEESAQALRNADRRKDEFLAMLAHELRNPLSSVGNAVTLLKETDAAEDHQWAADVIGRQTAQLSRLVDDLLDVSRITRGKIELRRELLDGGPCLESACEAVAPLIAERSHTLIATIPHGELWLEADPTRLEQIIVNLLANAAKYTEPRGHIWLDGRHEGDEIVITVRDDGAGIDPDAIPGMFELFAQGERSAARSEGGLGIGLTVVRGLCALHDGTVTAHSEGRGRGTTFTVRLPAADRPTAQRVSGRHGSPIREGEGLHVLVVDDNVDAAMGLARLLSRRGYEISLAHDGPAALQVARERSPNVVLLDIGLPGMDGYEVAKRLRVEPTRAGLLVVALTGYGQEEDRRLSQEAGIDHHLVKPVVFEEVRALLEKHTPKSR